MKLIFEIFRILRELGIKTKDIIGVGKNINKVGPGLSNASINPKVLQLVHKTGEISQSLKNELLNIGRSLRNLNDIEKRKFLTNLRQIKNVFKPEEAEVIDIATRAKLPASGIEKLKSNVGFPRNIHPESDFGRIMTHARKTKTVDSTKRAMQTGEARWILDKAIKDDRFVFKPEEIEIIKGGKGDVLEIFKDYFGNKALKNLPGEGSITAASKYFKQLDNAVDESGFLPQHPEFNKEAIDFKKTQELIKKHGNRLEGHPYFTETQLDTAMKAFDKAKGTFPRLDPDNDAFIILDAKGNKMGRYEGSVTADEVTGRSITKWWDKWDVENNKLFTDKSKYKFSGAMDDKGKDIITAEGVIEGGKSEIKKGIDDVMKDTSEAGLKKSIETDNLKLEFPGITDEMIENILTDTNPQRIAEVKATMKEALMMREKGMSPEAIMKALEDAFKRPKQASGGRVPGFATGGVSNLFRRR